MTDTPAGTHRMDQMLAAMMNIGAALGQLYKGLVEEGVPRRDAVIVTGEYAKGMAVEQWAAARDAGKEDQGGG